MISIAKEGIPLENYEKTISKNQVKFLLAKDQRGLSSKTNEELNPTDIRKGIMRNLGNYLKYIHQILKHTKNLEQDEIYEIFNAVNLQSILKSVVRDVRFNESIIQTNYKYDFKASENARLMLEIALDYLLSSPEFKDRQNTIDNAKRILEDFKLLSHSTLSKEREIIEINLSKKDEEKLYKHLVKFTNESDKLLDQLYEKFESISSLSNLPHSIEYKAIEKSLEQTRNKIIMIMSRCGIELNDYNKKLSNKRKKELKSKNENLIHELNEIEDCLVIIEKLKLNESKMLEWERDLYRGIENYFCPINSIKDFTIQEDIKKEVNRNYKGVLK